MRRSTRTFSSVRSNGLDREKDRTKGNGSEALGETETNRKGFFFSFSPFFKASFPISLLFTFLLSLLPVLFDLALKIILLHIYPTIKLFFQAVCDAEWQPWLVPSIKWSGLVGGHQMMPVSRSGGRVNKIVEKLAGDVACPVAQW